MKTKQTPLKKPQKARVKKATPVSLHAKVRHHAKRMLVPHKGNEFRPHLIRAQGLIAVLIIALLAQAAYGFFTTGRVDVLSRVSSIQTTDLLTYTNNEREAKGMADLQLNDKLSQAAYLKAQDMFEAQYWAHVSPSGVQPWKWFGDVGYSYSTAGENLAKNYPTPKATVDAWMNSESHRANILNDKFKEVGFAVLDGVLEDENTTLIVALYGSPATTIAVQPATTSNVGASESAAAANETNFLAPVVDGESGSVLSYLDNAMKSLSPVTIAILAVLAIVALVGAVAHRNRKKLPKSWQKSWKQHHGMYTFFGMIALGVLIIVATGGGQI